MKRSTRISNNFWQQQLEDANVTLHEMSELLECSYKYTVAYFSGFVHPTTDTIKAICKMLDVPLDLGIKKFDEIYEAWGKAHEDYEKYSNTYRQKSKKRTDKNGATMKVIKMGFWGHKLASLGISVKELATKLDKPYSTVSAYFTGYVLPDVEIIKKLCIMFNVDFKRGYQEFLKVHDNWGVVHADKYVKCGRTYKLIDTSVTKEPEPSVTVIPESEKETPVPAVAPEKPAHKDVIACQKILYGALSCDDFVQVMSMTTSYDSLLRFVYNKVDYDIFISLLS